MGFSKIRENKSTIDSRSLQQIMAMAIGHDLMVPQQRCILQEVRGSVQH